MRRNIFALATLAAATSMLPGAHANAVEFSAIFSGFEEIGGLGAGETGAIFSQGKATLDLDLNRSARTIAFTLTYSGLSAPVTQAHIHFGKEHVAGGIMVFFCSNLANPPPGTQPCPLPSGTVKGTITAGNVIGPTAQGITPGNFDAVVAALVSNTVYGNVHTMNFPAGEVRGQVRRGERDDDNR
jgi:CHRD domain-containing protein